MYLKMTQIADSICMQSVANQSGKTE